MPAPAQRPPGRLNKAYRVLWDQNSGQYSYYNPPMSPERVAQAHFGFFAGRPVDAYVGALGCNAGYNVSWPTQVANAEFFVDRLERGARIGSVQLWRHAEVLRRLWAEGHDPIAIEIGEAQRLGIDHWFRLSMNDWHHWGADNTVVNLQSSHFYDDHPEYLIGADGINKPDGSPGWTGKLAAVLPYFQDWMHEEVRALRRDIAVEACSRYPATGFIYDFMRCPGYFKYGQEEAGLEVMDQFMRQTRTAFNDLGRPVGLGVRVPTTIAGAKRLGLDVATWIAEDLVDLVIPSCFFGQDMEEDVSEWVALAEGTPVQIYPSIEEGYVAGHTSGFRRWYVNPPLMTPLTNEMIRGIAARHLQKGVDGIYVFNFFGTAPTYDYDNREAVDDIGDRVRLQHKDKTYALTRSYDSFPNCLQNQRQIPVAVGAEEITFVLEIADDLAPVRQRLRQVELWLHFDNLTVYDIPALTLNGQPLACANPKRSGEYDPKSDTWLRYDLLEQLPRKGRNRIGLRLAEGNAHLADEIAVEVADVELHLKFDYPDGSWQHPPGWAPPQ